MESMSHGGEIFGLGGDAAVEPSFETALRGYEKKQVERYVARAETEIAALASEREQAYSQLQAMAGQLDRLQQEAAQSRRQPALTEVSFRHLGPKVEEILAKAEEVAADIKSSATEDIAARLAEAERIRAEQQLAACEASDWFWWFGDYNPGPAVRDFDELFRHQLTSLYRSLNLEPPANLLLPISVGRGVPEAGGVMRRS
jgi:cell division septum initiation protein DivIVA